MRRFPDGFLWGVGDLGVPDRGLARRRRPRPVDLGRLRRARAATSGDVACDHYRRWREDVDLIAELGVNAYRFSIAWPRLFPTAAASASRAGFDHYDRLIDALLERGHRAGRDALPLGSAAGAPGRGRLAQPRHGRALRRVRARVLRGLRRPRTRWCTINEPWIIGLLGYLPRPARAGREGLRGEVTAIHHMLLAHGRAARRARASGEVGVAFSLFPHYPASDDDADREAARVCDGYAQPLVPRPRAARRRTRDDMRRRYEERIGALDFVRDGDLARSRTPQRLSSASTTTPAA